MAAALTPRLFSKLPTPALLEARACVDSVLEFRARQTSLFDPPNQNTIKRSAAPTGPVSAASAVPEACAEPLAPSSVNCWLDCSAKYHYRKVLGLPETRGLELGLGTAVHEAIAANFRQKLETYEDLPVEGAKLLFRDAFERQLDEGLTVREGEDVYDAAELGDALVHCFMTEAAPAIEPAAVELQVAGLVGDVAVRGYVDLLDVGGNVIDVKTAAKKPCGVRPSHRLQVTTYSMITPGATGVGRLDTITKTKTVKHYSETFEVGAADRRYAERMYSVVRDQMGAGLVAPNRSSHLCSRKYCSFASQCIDDYGGEVE